MNLKNLLGPWIRRFLLEHMVAERNLSLNTQASYRDTLALLLPYVSKHGKAAIDRMTVEDLSPAVLRQFLDHVERDRHCGGATRNLRLSAIHSLAHFIGMRSPVHLSWCNEIRSISFKKTAKTLSGYLEKPEMDALLMQPDRRTAMGARDYALLLFLYNSGARADEAAKLTIWRLQRADPASVRILGKGNKIQPTDTRVWFYLSRDRVAPQGSRPHAARHAVATAHSGGPPGVAGQRPFSDPFRQVRARQQHFLACCDLFSGECAGAPLGDVFRSIIE